MYIRPKKVFWTLVLLLALLYVGAHLAIRAPWVRGLVLQRLSARTGYAFSASELRFTSGLALSFKDFRLDRPASAGAEARTVAEAPWLRLGRRCGGWSVRAPRARLEAFREAGVWTPSQATGAEECPGACVFPRISPAFGNLYFDLSDAQVAFADGDARTAFVGVSWTRAPVRIPGRPGAVQNRLSWLKGPIRGDATADLATRGSDEWYELPGGIARLATQSRPAPAEGKTHAEPAESAEPASDGESAPGEPPPPAEEKPREESAESAEPASDAASAPNEPPPSAEEKPHAESSEPASDGENAPGEPPSTPAPQG